MSDNINEQSVVEATASAENATEATSLGRFKDTASLLEAYNNLEKEFTKRSQKLKAMENKPGGTGEMIRRIGESNPDLGELLGAYIGKTLGQEIGADMPVEQLIADALTDRILPSSKEKEGEFVAKYIERNQDVVDKLMASYLDKMPGRTLPKLNKNRGITVLTPPRRPKNLAEAGRMAEKYFS